MTDTSVAMGAAQAEEAELDESGVAAFAGSENEVSPQEISGSGFTYRHNWGAKNGWWTLNLNSSVFGPNTRVFVAASEGPTGNGGKFIGDAKYQIYNVAPNNGVVSIRIFVDWPNPIGVVVDYMIVNP